SPALSRYQALSQSLTTQKLICLELTTPFAVQDAYRMHTFRSNVQIQFTQHLNDEQLRLYSSSSSISILA
ncbi:Hypothetical predicted protein, partial [Paramuricea clavata]